MRDRYVVLHMLIPQELGSNVKVVYQDKGDYKGCLECNTSKRGTNHDPRQKMEI
jgi:hypothetical protein